MLLHSQTSYGQDVLSPIVLEYVAKLSSVLSELFNKCLRDNKNFQHLGESCRKPDSGGDLIMFRPNATSSLFFEFQST